MGLRGMIDAHPLFDFGEVGVRIRIRFYHFCSRFGIWVVFCFCFLFFVFFFCEREKQNKKKGGKLVGFFCF